MSLGLNQITILKDAVYQIYPISIESWNEIISIAYTKEIKKNDFFSKEGDTAKGLGFILQGVFRIYYLDDDGNEWNKHFLQKNGFMATSISIDKKAIANIQALTDTLRIHLPYQKLYEFSKQHSDLLLFIQKLSFSYLEQKQQREIDLLSQTASNNYLTFTKQFPGLEDKIQHFHIASYLGITPTQLSRVRKKIAHQQM